MKILITAGNTQTPIDEVRCITNIFTGRTGGNVAHEAARRGHEVLLLTSKTEVVAPEKMLRIQAYRTFDELRDLMREHISKGGFDAIIHAAAVSDYRPEGVYVPDGPTSFNPESATWTGGMLRDVSAGKVKSHHPELWLRLGQLPKLVDLIRRDWGFRGILVKFKLEVGTNEETLKKIALESRRQSDADIIVANTLERMHDWALIAGPDNVFRKIERQHLARELVDAVDLLSETSSTKRK